jgi:hypothetical protein
VSITVVRFVLKHHPDFRENTKTKIFVSTLLTGPTITVSPFSGASDICPQDDTAWRLLAVSVANTSIEISRENLSRLGRVLLPPEPGVLARACQQGFEDALRFLQRRYFLACTRQSYGFHRKDLILFFLGILIHQNLFVPGTGTGTVVPGIRLPIREKFSSHYSHYVPMS